MRRLIIIISLILIPVIISITYIVNLKNCTDNIYVFSSRITELCGNDEAVSQNAEAQVIKLKHSAQKLIRQFGFLIPGEHISAIRQCLNEIDYSLKLNKAEKLSESVNSLVFEIKSVYLSELLTAENIF